MDPVGMLTYLLNLQNLRDLGIHEEAELCHETP